MVKILQQGEMAEEEWPALFRSRQLKDATMDVSRLAKLWRGEISDEYGVASVVSTAAIALRAMGRVDSVAAAQAEAARLWAARDIAWLDRQRS